MNQEFNALKVFALIVIVGVSGYFAVNNTNSGFLGRVFNTDQSSLAINQSDTSGRENSDPSSSPQAGCAIDSFTASPTSININTASTLAWTTTGCTTTSISPTIGSVTPINAGSVSTGNLTSTTTYTLTASGGNTVTATTTVTVNVSSTTCRIVSFTADPTSVPSGSSSTLTWATEGCTSTSITPTIGTVTPPAGGSVSTGILTNTGNLPIIKIFKLTATGGNTVTATTTVGVDPVSFCAHNTWKQKADFGGGERNGAVGFSLNGKGYIGTGGSNTGLVKDFWEYNPVTNIWTQKADFGGGLRTSAVGFSISSKGYVGTGWNGSVNTKDFWEYDPTINNWTQRADFPGLNDRYMATGFSIGSKGYLGTGGTYPYTKDLWEYNPTSNVWTQKADFGGGEREGAVGLTIGSKGYVGTGYNNNQAYQKDFWEYDPVTNVWTQKADFGGGVDIEGTSFSIGTKGYVRAGTQQGFWEYNPATNLWTPKANVGSIIDEAATGFSIDSKGYIGTGWNGGVNTKDFWQYCP